MRSTQCQIDIQSNQLKQLEKEVLLKPKREANLDLQELCKDSELLIQSIGSLDIEMITSIQN